MELPIEKKDASRGSTLLTVPFTFKVTGIARAEVVPPTSTTSPTALAMKSRVIRSSASCVRETNVDAQSVVGRKRCKECLGARSMCMVTSSTLSRGDYTAEHELDQSGNRRKTARRYLEDLGREGAY